MAKMGRYCKAYTRGALREFGAWTENTRIASTENASKDGKDAEGSREWTDSDILYIQENFVVTADIYLDEGIVFDRVTPEWMEFCTDKLKFEVPAYEPAPSLEP
jgi:hypothetical protein